MYVDKGTVYSDAYKYLICANQIGFEFKVGENVVEKPINIDDLYISGNYARYNNDLFIQRVNSKWSYDDYKRDIIKKRYSNDDQIAIILNKDDSLKDQVKYNKMMEWRSFASSLAKKIVEFK